MKEKVKDNIFKLWITISTIIVVGVTIFILGYILKKGLSSIDLEFIFSNPKGIPLGSEGGIFPAIVGSLLLMLLSCIFASFLAMATAIYTVFYCNNKCISDIIHLIIQCMAGIPSIILGMFGYTLLILYFKIDRSLLTASITLGIMIFPYIEVRIEKIMREVDSNIIGTSYALGVSKFYTIFKLILPMCIEDITSAILLGGGFAMGAAAPIILTGAVIFASIPKSIFSPVMALPFHLYILTGEGISLEKAYGTAAILIILLLIINISSLILNRNRRGIDKWK
ncbi:ABC transporter permease subunit [uncultured Tissierella sp.]|jgi:phosphate transport system permease protein|uniref:PstA family ABC transporter permease n=1 Tax=Tissierella sp. TaxID=41274 RepID=UPI002805E004|nr:ABC transporter permease subunit [uncultured Tissierella sp.]MDU5082675.1 ABC transporter permease subunit [Bacillota bacterium]